MTRQAIRPSSDPPPLSEADIRAIVSATLKDTGRLAYQIIAQRMANFGAARCQACGGEGCWRCDQTGWLLPRFDE